MYTSFLKKNKNRLSNTAFSVKQNDSLNKAHGELFLHSYGAAMVFQYMAIKT